MFHLSSHFPILPCITSTYKDLASSMFIMGEPKRSNSDRGRKKVRKKKLLDKAGMEVQAGNQVHSPVQFQIRGLCHLQNYWSPS